MREIKLETIEGFSIGHSTDKQGMTGCTVIICEDGAVSGVDVRGGGPATRETDLLQSTKMVNGIHAVLLAGGSAYGLDAAGGVMKYLEDKKIGFDVGVGVVPIVCGASLFDLVVGDAKARPDQKMGYEACQNAGGEVAQGSVGAGTGATVGKLLGMDYAVKSGIGTYAISSGPLKIGAIVAINALGDIIDYETNEIISGLLDEDKIGFRDSFQVMVNSIEEDRNVFTENTTIGCIITNAELTKAQANKIASMAHNGYAQTIRPVHTSADGDAIFVMSSGNVRVNEDALGTLAAYVMAKAVNNSVKATHASGVVPLHK